MPTPVGQAIDAGLRALGKKPEWLADKLRVTPAAVSKWRKTGAISRHNAARVAGVLNISVDELLGLRAPAAKITAQEPQKAYRTPSSSLTVRQDLVLYLWSALSPEQEEEWLSELRAQFDANLEIAKHYGGAIKTAPNEAVARAFGAIPPPKHRPRGNLPRPPHDPDVDPAAGDLLDQ